MRSVHPSAEGTRRRPVARGPLAVSLLAAALAAAVAPTTAAAGPPPAACQNIAAITDVLGDGHHQNTDVAAGWLSEAAGHLQAVIQVNQAFWEPAHDDSDLASFAFLFQTGGATRYVRGEAPRGGAAIRFDFGSWTRSGGFVSAGATTGDSSTGGGGALTIDVPASIGTLPGTVLARPFILTWDGVTGDEPHWVDAAPGGTTPESAGAGADYVVGSCGAAAPPGGTLPGGPASGSGSQGPGPTGASGALTGITLVAPTRIVGAKTIAIRGAVTPAQAGVAIAIARTTRAGTQTLHATSLADGSFRLPVKVAERSTWRATAAGLGSQTLTTEVKARVRISVRRTKTGGAVITGTVSPHLPGRVLWLRTDAVTPSATTTPQLGRFVLHLKRPRPGRYQALFIPSKARADRALSNTGTIR